LGKGILKITGHAGHRDRAHGIVPRARVLREPADVIVRPLSVTFD